MTQKKSGDEWMGSWWPNSKLRCLQCGRTSNAKIRFHKICKHCGGEMIVI